MEKKSVYVMQYGKMCKIGVSKNPKERLKILQIGNPIIKLIYESAPIFNAYKIECKMHKNYKEKSIGREWFLIEDITTLVSALKKIVKLDGIFYIEEKNNKTSSISPDEILYKEIKRLRKEAESIRQETSDMKEENKRVNEFICCIYGTRNECDYTNLIYKVLFNKTAKQLEEEYGVKPRENLRDYFTGDSLAKVQSLEMLVSSLINCGWGYEQIKTFIQEQAIPIEG